MHEWLVVSTEYAITVIDAMALVVIAVATFEAFVRAILSTIAPPSGPERREIWLRYARWLVAALTFQLAADIIETSITTEWDALGRIAVVAVIRTFLNYFLDRDVARERQPSRHSGDLQ